MNPLPESPKTVPETLDFKHFLQAVPKWLLIANAAVLAVGLLLIGGRGTFAEWSAFDAMQNCDAKISPYLQNRDEGTWSKPNGLEDNFATIKLYAHRDDIAGIVSICEQDPAQGLRLFRKALNQGNSGAKLVACYCANYLARSQTTPHPKREKGVLEAADFDLLVKQLSTENETVSEKSRGEANPKSAKEAVTNVRRSALRAICDLIVITNPAALKAADDPNASNPYTAISAAMDAVATAALDIDGPKEEKEDTKLNDRTRNLKIALHKDTLNGKPVVLIRFSTPTLGKAWLKEHEKDGGKWDKDLQRFVVP